MRHCEWEYISKDFIKTKDKINELCKKWTKTQKLKYFLYSYFFKSCWMIFFEVLGNICLSSPVFVLFFLLCRKQRSSSEIWNLVSRAGRFEILYHLQVKLVCLCFIEAGRGHQTPGSEMKDFIIQSYRSQRISICVGSARQKSHRAKKRGLGDTCTHNGVGSRRGTVSLDQ